MLSRNLFSEACLQGEVSRVLNYSFMVRHNLYKTERGGNMILKETKSILYNN